MTVDKDTLTISGERRAQVPAEGSRTYAAERFTGAFRRVIELPRNADADKVEARYENGLLTITVGKREASTNRAPSPFNNSAGKHMMNDTTQIAQQDTGDVTRKADDTARRPALIPPVDIVEDTNGITLWADLPGVPRDRLDVKVHSARLFIEAEAVVATDPALRVHHREIRAPRFARSFTVSDDFDTTKIDANLQNGVLRLSIPRRKEARPRRVEVRAN
ncbi:Molecular chaperone (small heat shock protein) [Candidatus Paraburkholderia calva]|nr:Molecular chaperone (small heat shock protein) [Candidatus Paraburkholderia calva]